MPHTNDNVQYVRPYYHANNTGSGCTVYTVGTSQNTTSDNTMLGEIRHCHHHGQVAMGSVAG